MRQVAYQRPADAHPPGFFHHHTRHLDGDHRAEGAVGIHKYRGRRLVENPYIRRRIHGTCLQIFQVEGNAQHTMGVDSTQVCPEQDIRLGPRVFRRHASFNEYFTGEGMKLFPVYYFSSGFHHAITSKSPAPAAN